MTELTPIERRGDVWVKRDDLYRCGQAEGGKARAIERVAQGAHGLIGVGAAVSPQVARVAQVAKALAIPARVHTAARAQRTSYVKTALDAGAKVLEHRPGYLSVVRKRAQEDALSLAPAWHYVPFGGECEETVLATSQQVAQLPPAKRVVVAVGSGMTLAGILAGLKVEMPVLGVSVGSDPAERLDRWAPRWRGRVQLVKAPMPFETPYEGGVDGLTLHPLYEAKCVPYLRPDDLLWSVGL